MTVAARGHANDKQQEKRIRTMRSRFVAVFLLALLAAPVSALAGKAPGDKPVRLLEGHDFAAGGYSVVGLFWNRPRHPIQNTLGEFYVDDPALLEELGAQWVTGGPAPMYACGYHYTILLVRDRQIVDSFAINLETECGAVVTDGRSYRFDTALLTRHAEGYRKPTAERREFASLAEGREYLKTLAGNKRLLLMPEPQWREYDGEFPFWAPCPGHDHDKAKVAACIRKVRAEIETKYTGETFDLEETGSSGDRIMIDLKCSKALHARFDLYEDYWKWRDYEPMLILYWKQAE